MGFLGLFFGFVGFVLACVSLVYPGNGYFWFGLVGMVIGFLLFLASGSKAAAEQEKQQTELKEATLNVIKGLRKLLSNYELSTLIGFTMSEGFYEKDDNWKGFNSRGLFAIDEGKEVVILNVNGFKVINFKDIINVEPIYTTSEPITTPQVITTTTKKNNGIGRAIVGGILAGGVGALVGASTASTTSKSTVRGGVTIQGSTKMTSVRIYLNDINNPLLVYENVLSSNNETVYTKLLTIIARNEIIAKNSN